MMFQVMIKGPDGDAFELITSTDRNICEGAKLGAEALLKLLADDLELEEGYHIVMQQASVSNDSSLPYEDGLA